MDLKKTNRKVAGLFSAIALMAVLAGLVPQQSAAAQANCRQFPETGQQVCGRFLEYWSANGGLSQQGYPISAELDETSPTDGKTYKVQYFERAVFELHPENKAPFDVLLSLVGTFEIKRRHLGAVPQEKASTTNPTKFAQTGKTIGGEFRTYWEANGGVAQQGYPISDEFQEVSELDGKTYTVQYFERAVFEKHPENKAPYNVLLAQLGKFWYERWNGTVLVKPTGSGNLNASGATFPVPLYTKWFQEYKSKLNPDLTINYQGTGSGAGITAITNKTVDFAGSDALLSDAQMGAAAGVQMIPMVAGAVVPVYNVTGVKSGLVLDGDTLANIYLGNITKWNDAKITALNAGVTLPDAEILVARRSDGSGTTNIFTNFLSAASADWKSKVGAGTSVNWPVGLGGQGNPGVAAIVKQTPNSIGYVELAYASQNGMDYARMKNSAGNVVDASPASTSAAARGLQIPDDYRVIIVNSKQPDAWPIAGFTFVLLYKDMNNISDLNKAKGLAEFLWWGIHRGQDLAYDPTLLYAPLPRDVVKKVEVTLLGLTYKGQKLLGQ